MELQGQTRIELCGRLSVTLSGRSVERALPARQGRLLLAYLTLGRDRAVSRDELLDLVWPSDPPADPDAVLTALLSKLRRGLGEGVLNGRRELRLELPPGAWIDVEAARDAVARAERALDRGDPSAASSAARSAARIAAETFLVGHEGAWVEEVRRELDELHLRALECVAAAGVELGGPSVGTAERAARSVVSSAPLRESGSRLLMAALAARGNAAEALRVYDALRVRLRDELGATPGPAVAALHERLLGGKREEDAGGRRSRGAPDPESKERKLVTVLAARLGAPADREGLDSERLGAMLDQIHAAISAQIEEAGGRVEARLGEELIAVFGAPVAQEDHVERALESGLAVRRTIGNRGQESPDLGIGVDTGEVVVARGTPLAGEAVTTARRLALAAGPGRIMVSARTSSSAGDVFELGPPASGESEPGARPLLRALSATRVRRAAAAHASFVGRERELELLQASYRRALAEECPQLVTVVGDAGVGKTRLVQELWGWLASETPEPLRRTGRCLAYGHGITYRPLADVLREQLGLLETDDPEVVRRRLGDRPILGLTLGLEVDPKTHPLEAQDRLHAGWVELLSELTAAQPAVILVEDLHWAQEPLLDALERLVDTVTGPLLLVCTGRPELAEERPSWGRRRDATTVWLEPLADPDAARMLDGLLPTRLPDRLRARLLASAEGNPFFLEELLASLLDSGSLDQAGLEADPSATIPDSVLSVLASRIDLLPEAEKAALQAASVIGRVFWLGPLLRLLGGEAPELSLLESRDFIRRRSPSALAGEREFAFKHALTREVAYSGLTRSRRARLHASFADWLERELGERDEHAALLAHHYAEAANLEHADIAWAGNPRELDRIRERALGWLGRAAELAIARYEIDDGIALLERALELETEDPGRVEIWRSIGRAGALKYDAARFSTAMEEAIALCSDRERLARLYAELAFETSQRAGMWRRRPDGDLVDGWIERALELAAPGSRPRAEALIAWSNWDPAGSGDAPREAGEIADRLDDPELCSYAWDAQGIAALARGDYETGWQLQARRQELLDQITDPEHVADIYYAPITGAVARIDFERARYLARKHEEVSLALTPHHRIHGIGVLIEVEELAGEWDAVLALQDVAEERVRANTETPCVRNARALLVCGLANAHAGDAGEARRLEEEADGMGMEGFGHVLDTPRLRLALLRGDFHRVEELLSELIPDRGWHRGWLLLATQAAHLDALAALGRREDLESWPRDHVRAGMYLEPFILRALGLVREDERLIEEAVGRFERSGLNWHAAETRTMAIRG